MNSDIKRNFKLDQFHQLVELLINQYDIPTETKRVALNLKVASFYHNRSGIQPIEVQLERANANEPWEVRFIASFDYLRIPVIPDTGSGLTGRLISLAFL